MSVNGENHKNKNKEVDLLDEEIKKSNNKFDTNYKNSRKQHSNLVAKIGDEQENINTAHEALVNKVMQAEKLKNQKSEIEENKRNNWMHRTLSGDKEVRLTQQEMQKLNIQTDTITEKFKKILEDINAINTRTKARNATIAAENSKIQEASESLHDESDPDGKQHIEGLKRRAEKIHAWLQAFRENFKRLSQEENQRALQNNASQNQIIKNKEKQNNKDIKDNTKEMNSLAKKEATSISNAQAQLNKANNIAEEMQKSINEYKREMKNKMNIRQNMITEAQGGVAPPRTPAFNTNHTQGTSQRR